MTHPSDIKNQVRVGMKGVSADLVDILAEAEKLNPSTDRYDHYEKAIILRHIAAAEGSLKLLKVKLNQRSKKRN